MTLNDLILKEFGFQLPEKRARATNTCFRGAQGAIRDTFLCISLFFGVFLCFFVFFCVSLCFYMFFGVFFVFLCVFVRFCAFFCVFLYNFSVLSCAFLDWEYSGLVLLESSEVCFTRGDLNSNANGSAKAKAKVNAKAKANVQERFPSASKSLRVQRHAANKEIWTPNVWKT